MPFDSSHFAGTMSSRIQQPQHAGDIQETFQQMLDIEDTACKAFAAEQEQFQRKTSSASPRIVSPAASAWRERVAQWCYDVIDHLGENRELAYAAMNILDRYSGCTPSSERAYEMEAMSALFLAVRIGGSGNLALHQLVAMSRDGVVEKDIVSTGKRMISALKWDQQILTPADFVRYFVDAVASSFPQNLRDALLDSAMFLIELAVFDAVLARKRPSNIAATAVMAAINRMDSFMPDVKARLTEIINTHTMERFGDMSPLLCRLELICLEGSDNQKSLHPHVILDEEVEDLQGMEVDHQDVSYAAGVLPVVSQYDLALP